MLSQRLKDGLFVGTLLEVSKGNRVVDEIIYSDTVQWFLSEYESLCQGEPGTYNAIVDESCYFIQSVIDNLFD